MATREIAIERLLPVRNEAPLPHGLPQLRLRQPTVPGNLSRVQKPDTWHYTWDADDRLTGVTTPDGARWRYLYDPFGRRIAKQPLSADGSGVEEQTDFTWDGPALAEQTTQAAYLPGPHTLSWDHNGLYPLAQTETIATALSAGTPQAQIDRRFFAIVTDLVGTPTELVDPATNAIAWRATPTLWGHMTWPADSTTYTPMRFPGQYFDAETRLHYNLHRYYDPDIARYTSPDPLGLAPAPNPEAYVGNPHLVSDPLGLSPHRNGSGGGTVSLFKAPQRGLGEHQENNGYLKADFPGGPHDPYEDGKAYFAKGDRGLADKYAKHYGEGVIEIHIPVADHADCSRNMRSRMRVAPSSRFRYRTTCCTNSTNSRGLDTDDNFRGLGSCKARLTGRHRVAEIAAVRPFGMFVKIPGHAGVAAVVDAISYYPDRDPVHPDSWPAVGDSVEGVVSEHSEHNRQIKLRVG
ncbi:RHS repeat-associated protein [Streptomyces sp. TLI_235]|nr:RHS repeat-associated protein [Streptomyces sp. TLI_235]